MNELSHSQIPPGGWQFFQPQTRWSVPNPISVTFDQAVLEIVKHRLANGALVARHGLSVDANRVAQELDTYTRIRLRIPAASPKTFPPLALPPAVGDAAAAVKKLASGAALLFEWEESGMAPAAAEQSRHRAGICAVCPKNTPGEFSRWFTQPISEMFRKKLQRLTQMNLTTPVDARLNVCQACLCPLKLKVHAPLVLILKHLRPEAKESLDPKCWILVEEKSAAK